MKVLFCGTPSTSTAPAVRWILIASKSKSVDFPAPAARTSPSPRMAPTALPVRDGDCNLGQGHSHKVTYMCKLASTQLCLSVRLRV